MHMCGNEPWFQGFPAMRMCGAENAQFIPTHAHSGERLEPRLVKMDDEVVLCNYRVNCIIHTIRKERQFPQGVKTSTSCLSFPVATSGWKEIIQWHPTTHVITEPYLWHLYMAEYGIR